MSVYVDQLRVWNPRNLRTKMAGAKWGQRWCHMWADTEEELHAMAEKIGMKRSWFQRKSRLPHYDLVPSRREAAIQAGAVEKELREALKEKRKEQE